MTYLQMIKLNLSTISIIQISYKAIMLDDIVYKRKLYIILFDFHHFFHTNTHHLYVFNKNKS